MAGALVLSEAAATENRVRVFEPRRARSLSVVLDFLLHLHAVAYRFREGGTGLREGMIQGIQ